MTERPESETPAGTPAEQAAVDRPWRTRALIAVGTAVTAGALIGFVIIPAGQKGGAGLTLGHAMERAAGLQPGSPAVPQPLSTASSIPVSTVSWGPDVMRILDSGRVERGAQLAASACAACHGDKGLSPTLGPGPIFPSLAGQTAEAIYKQLHDFKSGARFDPQMTPVAQKLSITDLANVSAYYAAASKEYAAIGQRELIGDAPIEKLAKEGDSRRRIPACLACHVNNAGGPIETPVITGQPQSYLLLQMNNFASGQRQNDVYGRMRDISRKLTPEERAELARFFQGTL
jgi:cytochrome c553